MARQIAILHCTAIAWLAGAQLWSCAPPPATGPVQANNFKEKCVPTRDAAMLKSREAELRVVAEKLLRAFRIGDTQSFLGLVHPHYFTVGESRNYTIAELKEAFRVKDEMYCYLFDATCVPPPAPNDTAETSFSEVAKRPEARVQSLEVWSEAGLENPGCSGSVGFAWVEPTDPVYVSIFTFMYAGGQWKAVGFAFPPAAPPGRPQEPKPIGGGTDYGTE